MNIEPITKAIREAKELEFAAKAWFECEKDVYAVSCALEASKRKWIEAVTHFLIFIY
jgi:hypothetical protein